MATKKKAAKPAKKTIAAKKASPGGRNLLPKKLLLRKPAKPAPKKAAKPAQSRSPKSLPMPAAKPAPKQMQAPVPAKPLLSLWPQKPTLQAKPK